MGLVGRIVGIFLTALGVFFIVLGLTNSLIGLPEFIVQPLCPANLGNDGYVDWDDFVNKDCVSAVKNSSDQALPYFQLIDSLIIISGIGMMFIAWILGIFRRRKAELRGYGGRRISGRLEGQYMPVAGNDPLAFSDHSHLFDEQTKMNVGQQQIQQQSIPPTSQTSEEVGFRNPFDF